MSKKLPNIVLMVLDTVGAKHLSLYGYSRPTTPHLEKIAQECTVYTRCFAPGCWTVPSHGSLFTGLYPSQHGAYEKSFILRDNLPHLVSILKASGYRTVGISTNGLVSPATGLCQDFDEFHDLGARDLSRILGEGAPSPETQQADELSQRLKKVVKVSDALGAALRHLQETRRVGELLRKALELGRRWAGKFIRPGPLDNATSYTGKTLRLMRDLFRRPAASGTPFFLFVNCLQAHHDYRPPLWRRRFSRWHHRAHVSPLRFYRREPSPALGRLVGKYRNLYDDEISYLDTVLGRIWGFLRQAPWFDDTLVIFTSDHGEHLGEKGHYTHILSLYNELLWVPLIVRYPRDVSGPGRVDPRLASLTDIYATILDMVDCPLPRPDSSFSLLAPPRRETAIAQLVHPEMWHVSLANKEALSRSRGERFSPPVFAVMTDGGLKVIGKRDGGLEVYDLKGDMAEDCDLAAGLPPEVLENYRSLLESWKAETGFHEAAGGSWTQAPEGEQDNPPEVWKR